jgi:hypothetical protein
MQRLVQVFFVSPKYLQEGEENSPIFQTFRFNYDKDICRRFLEENFKPVFLCRPDFRDSEMRPAYLVFTKWDDGYWRSAQSIDYTCFHSNYEYHNGLNHLNAFISTLLDRNMRNFTPSCFDIEQKEWETLQHSCWYNKGMREYPKFLGYHAWDILECAYKELYQQRYNTSLPDSFYLRSSGRELNWDR